MILEIYDSTKYVYWKVKSFRASTFDFKEVLKAVNGNFLDYKTEFKKMAYKLLKAGASDDNIDDPNCKDCINKAEYEIKTIENVLEN